MTTIHRYINLHAPVEKVWLWISEVTNWDIVGDAFMGKKNSFRHMLEFDAAQKGQKMRVFMSDPNGKNKMIWNVTEWKPREQITLQTEHAGFLSGFRAVVTFKIEHLITGQTRINLILEIDYKNLGIKSLAFFMPVQMLYGRRLNRSLEAIRDALQ